MEYPSSPERLIDAESVFSTTYGTYFVTDNAKGAGTEQRLEHSPQVRHAFRASRNEIEQSGVDPDDAEVVLSEAVGNALRYGHGLVGAWWGRQADGSFCIAVFDRNTGVVTLPGSEEDTPERQQTDPGAAEVVFDEAELLQRLVRHFGEDHLPESGRGLGMITQFGFAYRRTPVQLSLADSPPQAVMATFFRAPVVAS